MIKRMKTLAILTACMCVISASAQLNAEDVKPAKEQVNKNTEVKDKGKTDEYIQVPFNFSLIPIKIVGKKKTTHFSIHLLGDYTDRLMGTSIGTGVSIVGEDMHGAQLSVIGNHVGGNAKYLQAAVGFNITGGDFKGYQAASVFNINRGDFRGFQSSSGFNIARGDLYGFQAAPLFSYTSKKLTGCQMSSVFNYAGSFKGAQLSVVNVSGDMKGAQTGLVNVAGKASGAQIGLVNYSKEMSGVPFGLISIVAKGQTNVDVWGDDLGFAKIGLKHGTKNFYSIYTVGKDIDSDLSSIGLGYGGRIQGKLVSFNFDMTGNSIRGIEDFWKGNSVFHAQARAYAGLKIFRRLSLIAGVSYNYCTNFGEDNTPEIPESMHGYEFSYSSDDHSFWPGVFVGVQL